MGFDAFDPDKKGIIASDTVGTILGMMGMKIPSDQLLLVISEFDPFGKSNNYESPIHGPPTTLTVCARMMPSSKH